MRTCDGKQLMLALVWEREGDSQWKNNGYNVDNNSKAFYKMLLDQRKQMSLPNPQVFPKARQR